MEGTVLWSSGWTPAWITRSFLSPASSEGRRKSGTHSGGVNGMEKSCFQEGQQYVSQEKRRPRAAGRDSWEETLKVDRWPLWVRRGGRGFRRHQSDLAEGRAEMLTLGFPPAPCPVIPRGFHPAGSSARQVRLRMGSERWQLWDATGFSPASGASTDVREKNDSIQNF